jgi:pimeloyl-ACP methyl ester carboxylesterase
VAAIANPALILAWDTDPGHPVSTAERLHELLPVSELHVATTLDAVREWPERIAGFLTPR